MHDLIAGGRFQNQSEVVRAGLRLLEEREYGQDKALESQLVQRLSSPSVPWTKSDLDKVRKLAGARLKRGGGLKRAA